MSSDRYAVLTEDDREIAARIRRRMREYLPADVDQGEFADMIDINRSTFKNYLNVRSRIPAPVLKTIATALSCRSDYLLGLEYEDQGLSSEPATRADIEGIGRKLDILISRVSATMRHAAPGGAVAESGGLRVENAS